MSAATAGKSSSKKRGSESDVSKSEKLKRVVIEDDFDADLSKYVEVLFLFFRLFLLEYVDLIKNKMSKLQ